MNLSLVTCTGDRHAAFSLCQLFMSRQTYRGDVQWLVCDDGVQPTRCTMSQTVVRRAPSSGHTLPANFRAALPLITGDVTIIIEDDDHYPENYLAGQAKKIEAGYEISGEADYRSYHLGARKAGRFLLGRPMSSLSRTAICTEALLNSRSHAYECCNIDIRLWAEMRERKWWCEPIDDPAEYVVGMKGLPGRRGLTDGHLPDFDGYDISDLHGNLLRSWVGDEDAELYLSIGSTV